MNRRGRPAWSLMAIVVMPTGVDATPTNESMGCRPTSADSSSSALGPCDAVVDFVFVVDNSASVVNINGELTSFMM